MTRVGFFQFCHIKKLANLSPKKPKNYDNTFSGSALGEFSQIWL
jgi:hypothetical protein